MKKALILLIALLVTGCAAEPSDAYGIWQAKPAERSGR